MPIPLDSPWFVTLRQGRVLFVRVRKTPTTLEGVKAFGVRIEQARHEAGQPILLIGMPSPGLTLPSDEIRAAIQHNVKTQLKNGNMERSHVVVPAGNLFVRAIIRSFFSGLKMMLGLRNEMALFDRLDDAISDIAQRYGIKAEELQAAARTLAAHDPE